MKAYKLVRYWGDVVLRPTYGRRRLSAASNRVLEALGGDRKVGQVWKPFLNHNWAYGWNMSQVVDMKEAEIPGLRVKFPELSRENVGDEDFLLAWIEHEYGDFEHSLVHMNHAIVGQFLTLVPATFALFGGNKTLVISAAGAFMTEVLNPLIRNPYTSCGSSLFWWTLYGAALSLGIPSVSLRGAVQAFMLYLLADQAYWGHWGNPPNWYAAPEGFTVQHWSHWLDGDFTAHTMHYTGLLTGVLAAKYLTKYVGV